MWVCPSIRNQFGKVLELLDKDKDPILITKSKKVRAVLIRYEDFKTRFLDKQAEEEQELFAIPELFTYEILSVLYRLQPEAQEIYSKDINRILHSGILRYPMTENIYTKADRFIKKGLIGYDAVYIALAEELDGLWLTFDAKAHNKIVSENLSINLFETNI